MFYIVPEEIIVPNLLLNCVCCKKVGLLNSRVEAGSGTAGARATSKLLLLLGTGVSLPAYRIATQSHIF
jgi:hypothetical protein